MKNIFLALFAVLLTVTAAHAQKTRIYGVVKDASSAEPLISANVVYGDGLGVVTDLDGNFSISLANGDYTLSITYIGYEAITKQVKA
ncbi:MAG: carboxypeptidase-like regulatory domain-containing protein, partial [Flavobacteriales bacterium]